MASHAPRNWFESLFGFTEEFSTVKNNIECRAVGDGSHKLVCPHNNGKEYTVGHFNTPSLGQLRGHVMGDARYVRDAGKPSIVHHLGASDILEEHHKYPNAMFQVASQFNCLEFAHPDAVPEDGVTDYVHDRTQGPACSVACGAATVYRNYFAPVPGAPAGTPPGQSRGCQINNLRELERKVDNAGQGYWAVRNGYTHPGPNLKAFKQVLTKENYAELRDSICIGLQERTEVTFDKRSPHWPAMEPQGVLVSQAFCSAVSCAYTSAPLADWAPLAQLVLEAAYQATLWAAIAGGCDKAFLTFIGGGVFGNDMDWIAGAIGRAVAAVDGYGLEVVVVHFRAVEPWARDLVDQAVAAARGGGPGIPADTM